MGIDLALLCIWLAAGVYILLGFWWRRRRTRRGLGLGDEVEAYAAGYARGKELLEQGLSEEEMLALGKQEAATWTRRRRRRR